MLISTFRRYSRRILLGAAAALAWATVAVPSATASDQIYFPAVDNVTNILVGLINAEQKRVDIGIWLLSEGSITIALKNKWNAGVPVRIIGDRVAIFESDPNTRNNFYQLAALGIPIRLRYNPTWYPEVNHWKTAIFAGQNKVLFGSGNFAPTELAPFSSNNYDDESEMVTDDPVLVGAFKTKFDQMWNDTTPEPSCCSAPPYLKNWDDACALESACSDYHTLFPNAKLAVVDTSRLEPDNPMPADLIWGQGPVFNNRMVDEINKETNQIDLIEYRLTVPEIGQALLARWQAGVKVRLIVDTDQYANRLWPEYWLTHAYVDQLYAAGIPIRQRVHFGVTHMKTIITSTYATNASSNYAANWQRDQDYFVSAATKPTIYQALKNRFQTMWDDNVGFTTFSPQRPDAANLSSPANTSVGASTTPTLVWKTAAFATSYDVYLGTSANNLAVVGRVDAVLNQGPPSTYSFTPSTPLASGTQYFWKVVSRTFATPVNAAMVAPSDLWSFTTAGNVAPPGVPGSPNPANGATGVATAATLTWAASGATSYDVRLGTTNPPPTVASNRSTASYSTNLAANTTYFWQIVARNASGSTTGPVWTFATGAAAGGGVPAPWANADVGNTGQAGSATFSNGTFTVRGAGADIWGGSDGFQYVYQTLSGDGEIIARVSSIANTSSFAKAGVMIRESLAANAAHVILDLRPTNDIEFMTRPSTGAQTTWLTGTVQAAPAWLRLTRTGSTITSAVSANGSSWTTVGSTTLSIGANALVGLIVTSHDTSVLNTSTFDNVSVSTSQPPPPGPPAAPGSPNPANGATGVSSNPTLSWSSSGATSYDVKFGTSNPPSLVSSGQAASSYVPGSLSNSTTYFWQVVARNASGTTPGPVWSFTTAAAPPPPAANIVIYASDIPAGAFHGAWTTAADGTAAAGVKMITLDNGVANTNNALASPNDYVDVTFDAPAGTPYTLWLRMQALGNSKWNDSLWVQFSDAGVYPLNTTQGLLVNLATDSTASSLNGWGWQNGAYWLSQSTTVTFANSGTHTLRIQTREDGVQVDQIVLSPNTYLGAAPGPAGGDHTIVPKP